MVGRQSADMWTGDNIIDDVVSAQTWDKRVIVLPISDFARRIDVDFTLFERHGALCRTLFDIDSRLVIA